MSVVRKIAWQLAVGTNLVLQRVLARYGISKRIVAIARFVPRISVRVPRPPVRIVRQPRYRIMQQLIRSAARTQSTQMRAVAIGVWEKMGAVRHSIASQRVHKLPPLLRTAERFRHDADVLSAVRAVLALPQTHHDVTTGYPRELKSYDLRDCIAHGCCGAVYEARVRGDESTTESVVKSVTPAEKDEYPLVIKILFNYDIFASVSSIWQFHEPELVTTVDSLVKGRMKFCRPLTEQHPNIVPICTAFDDVMPILPGAQELYPEALPAATDVGPIEDPLRVLFLVMKRYTTTLHQYLMLEVTRLAESTDNHIAVYSPESVHKRSVMVAQLFEAVDFLHRQKVAHRDLKSDNILLHMEHEDEPPHVLLTDFGCCLAPRHNKHNMRMLFNHDEVDLGGNVCLRAPEISKAKPSRNCFVDYAKSDLWAAGSIAIEMFTGFNPFVSNNRISPLSYERNDFAYLPDAIVAPLREMIYDVLNSEPEKRPEPAIAATTSAMVLARAFDPRVAISSARKAFFTDVHVTLAPLDTVIAMYAVETIVGASRVISKAEHTLRTLFLRRTNHEEIQTALHCYFLPQVLVQN